ncbi:MAG: hypothetical protein ABDK87_00710 [Atribacterota bacterium]
MRDLYSRRCKSWFWFLTILFVLLGLFVFFFLLGLYAPLSVL